MKHDAVWCLGNAYTSYARLTPDDTQARLNFGLAYLFFGIAVAQVIFFPFRIIVDLDHSLVLWFLDV